LRYDHAKAEVEEGRVAVIGVRAKGPHISSNEPSLQTFIKLERKAKELIKSMGLFVQMKIG